MKIDRRYNMTDILTRKALQQDAEQLRDIYGDRILE